MELDYGLAPLPDLASEVHSAALCYAFFILFHFSNDFLLLAAESQRCHASATVPAGHCGGHGAHVDAKRTAAKGSCS